MVAERYFTPPQAADIIGANADKVIGWIHSGELVASNVAANPNGERPRWRISEDELAKFLFRRQHPASTLPAKPKRKRHAATTAPRYFA
ncbi:helix-turn-helix domain-containing protein [Rosistilla oblonga]|uniref:Helix-turn-helix domain protein n=1 Tax=Rosistilla oblonga TaxID=2527990 RepID=A0A518IQX0_9BACT|nr:helix-turn-helix domain-containing protein [Rosistilla oblonga]QDV55485.1 Helix-turn-helix domain protein [Rosistilla oblonga]